ncbi:restriction endonuclease subunit S [Rhodococcus sp. GG48]|nr:restriction endonuclease subunit S [Rhodococcus sp. GG48]
MNSSLSDLATNITEKVVGAAKVADTPYVGLEHLITDTPKIAGSAPASTSVSVNTVFRAGDTLFGKLRPNLRKVALADFDGYCSTDILVLRPANGNSASFLSHQLRSRQVLDFAAGTAFGTKMPRTSWSLLQKLSVYAPPVPEQRRIAEVLDTLDDQIRATEQILSKLHLVRHGLLIDLMTRGIDEKGKLRDPSSRSSDFTESPIGQLPRVWQVKQLGDLLTPVSPAMRSGPFGSALLKHELVDAGVPLLGIDNVHIDRFVSDYVRFVTPAKARELARYRVRPRDVMITIMGTVGRACLVPDDIGEALSSKHVWTMSFDQERYLPYLASLQLNHSPWARSHLRKDEQGGIMSAIRSDTLRSLLLPVPPIEEQYRIASILQEADKRLTKEAGELAKLRLARGGLANDLLTGRVRVLGEAEV